MCTALDRAQPASQGFMPWRKAPTKHANGKVASPVNPRSPGTHIVCSWVIDSISLYRDPMTGTQYLGNWASRVSSKVGSRSPRPNLMNLRVP